MIAQRLRVQACVQHAGKQQAGKTVQAGKARAVNRRSLMNRDDGVDARADTRCGGAQASDAGLQKVAPVSCLPRMQVVPSPNADERPAGIAIDTVILHYISLPPEHFRGEAVQALFTNTIDGSAHPYFERLVGLKVSAHFFLRRHGQLLQFVHPDRRAWHAGVSRLLDRERCNDFSIGIELEGSSRRPFTERQYQRLLALLESLFERYPVRYIAGHSDVAPGRKEDPGPFFEWQRLQPLLDRFGVIRPF